MTIVCHHVNLRQGWGGAEIYTASCSRALLAKGIDVRLYVHKDNPHWEDLLPPQCAVVQVAGLDEVLHSLDGQSWLLFQTPLTEDQAKPFKRRNHLLTAVAHMTLYGRSPNALKAFDFMGGDSQYVLDSLADAGYTNFHQRPLYGVAEMQTREAERDAPIVAHSPYGWDPRKGRDRLLSVLYPLYERLQPRRVFVKRPGISIGIVSRLADPKQFPLMFDHLAPILREYPEFNLEIFGDGGYATVRDMRRALAPIRKRVRFWGYQKFVGSIYPLLDYVLAGLPEKEAFGLNLVEAQLCGTPVLAVNAPPFAESVADGITGYLFEDPRRDGGSSFAAALDKARLSSPDMASTNAKQYLARFSDDAYRARISSFVDEVTETFIRPNTVLPETN